MNHAARATPYDEKAGKEKGDEMKGVEKLLGRTSTPPPTIRISPAPRASSRIATNTAHNRVQKPPEEIPTPPIDDDAYVLEAFGDISLSNIDFVPPPPTTLSPRNTKESLKIKRPESISRSSRRRLGYTHRIKAPSLSKARIDATDMSFESLVASYKQNCEDDNTKASFSRAGGSRRAAASELETAHPFADLKANHRSSYSLGSSELRKAAVSGAQIENLLADLKNLGGEAVIPGRGSHDVVESRGYTKALVESAVNCAVGRDENGASTSAPGVDVPLHVPLQGNARLPKRAPIPRWDDDNSWQQSQRATDVTTLYKLA
ncbi:hypothetical protein BDN70DRAFT_880365 [Pholiota conissans]|uniref:Uncharacterized protein n=1 Tax=Pholiota conissans TaxID=109636 RepID=A0A9P5YZK7_9AGAR|nr:hypothetical protein BDN70DRAFT_880365 [Pholiota conissans]